MPAERDAQPVRAAGRHLGRGPAQPLGHRSQFVLRRACGGVGAGGGAVIGHRTSRADGALAHDLDTRPKLGGIPRRADHAPSGRLGGREHRRSDRGRQARRDDVPEGSPASGGWPVPAASVTADARPDGDRGAGDRRGPGDPAAHVRDRQPARATPGRSGWASRPSPTTPRARSWRPPRRRRDRGAVRAALAALGGEIDQVPSAVSAIKINGCGRTSGCARRGGRPAPRRVTMSRLDGGAVRRVTPDVVDVDMDVTCTSGTYVRASHATGRGARRRWSPHRAATDRCRRVHPRRGGHAGRDGGARAGRGERSRWPTPPSGSSRAGTWATRRPGCWPRRAAAAAGIAGPYAVFGPGGRGGRYRLGAGGRARAEIVLAPA